MTFAKERGGAISVSPLVGEMAAARGGLRNTLSLPQTNKKSPRGSLHAALLFKSKRENLVVVAVLEGGAQDVAERSAGVGRTELCDGFLLFCDLESLDRQADLAVLLGEVDDAGVNNLTNLETLGALFVTGHARDLRGG